MLGPGVPVTSKKGKLEVLKRHYVQLGTCSGRDSFDDSWKEEVDKKCEHPEENELDREIDFEEIGTIWHNLFPLIFELKNMANAQQKMWLTW